MRYRLLYMLLLLLAPQVMTAQNYEYWLDNDYAGRVSKYGELGEVSFEVDVSMLNPGIHYLNCRGRQQNSVTSGNSYDAWGTIKRTMFYVIDTKNCEQPIRVEYWLDSDYAGRVSEATSGGAVAIEKNLSELTSGIHYLNMRSLGAAGQWGTIKRTMFYVDHSVKSFANVRCWIDDAPATAVTQKVEGGTVSLSIDVSELNAGDHTLYVQGMGSDGGCADIRSFAFQNSTDINEPANQRISLQEVPFWQHEDGLWGLNAPKNTQITPEWVVGESTDLPYGDSSVNHWADLSGYDKLVVTVTEGTPRILLNRDEDEGIWNENEEESHLIDNTKGGWSSKYFTQETTTSGEVYTVDLKQILIDKGFVHLHAIKSGAWGEEVTVESIEVVNNVQLTNVQLTADMFYDWDGFGPLAQKTGQTTCKYVVGEPTDDTHVAYGDPKVISFADLSAYSRLEVTVTEGTPRFLFNREYDYGQWCSDETMSHMIEYPNEGWSSKYFSHEGNVWSVDLKQMVADKGFAHLHAIKAPWNSQITVTKMELVDDGDNVYPEAYAVPSEGNTTLTFYYDTNKSNHGDAVSVVPFSSTESRGWDSYASNITRVEFDKSFANCLTLTSTANWFMGCNNLATINGTRYIKTPEVTDMQQMFFGCSSLTSLDLSSFNTAKVSTMLQMFFGCSALTTIYVGSGWNVASLSNAETMFEGCDSLVGGYGTAYDTDYLENSYARIDRGTSNPGYLTGKEPLLNEMMFAWDGVGAGAQKTSQAYSDYVVGESTDIAYGRDNVDTDVYVDLSSYSRLEVTTTEGTPRFLFNRDVTDGEPSENEAESHLIDNTHEGCMTWASKYFSSQPIDGGTLWTVNLEQLVQDKGFAHLHAIKGANDANVTVTKMDLVIAQNVAIEPEAYAVLSDDDVVLSQSATDVTYGKKLTFFYDGQKTARNGMNVDFTDSMLREWNSSSSMITSVVFDSSFANDTTLTSTAWWFYNLGNLTTITGIENLNTNHVTNMYSMFAYCPKLTSLDVSGFNTSKVTDMGYMFGGCSGLTTLNVSGFNTSNVTNMRNMFDSCSGLTSLDVSNFNTANVTNMYGMFMNCSGLTTLDLSSFNTAKVEVMDNMFCQNTALTTISVDGTKWNTGAVTSSISMFYMCPNLVGGKGTTYDANHVDASYAHIDGGMANPGYFTAKGGLADPLLARLYDNLALTTTDGNADGGNNDLSVSIDAAQTSLVRAMWNLQELPTDESYCVWMDAGIPALNTNTWSDSTQTQSMRGFYARLYHGIALANNYLANQHDGDMGKQAEARFLRALQYYYLMDHFGNVPLLTDTIDRQPLPVWEATPSDIELLTREEMFSYIENELQESLNSLPATNSYGRATATAARLLLARLYLNSEVYTGTARWQEARSYAESVINGGTFQLAPIYRNLFMGDNDSNGAQQEIILPAIYDGNTRTDYGGTTFLVASSFTNGEGDNGTTQVWAGNVSKPDFVNKFFTQTADIPYASPEQTASAAGDDRALFYGINHSYELRNGDSFSDGFPYQKFTNVRSNGTSPVSSKFADTDFPLMRLGEAYLIAAEADARLNGSATSMQGTQYINMLRNRANATTSTAGYSLSDICDEWSREMGYEAVRRTTLIRFGRFGGQTDYSWAWKGGSYDGTAFDAGMNTYPIPAVEVGSTPEPYVVLTDSNTVMTFYYDGQKATRVGIDINNSNLGDSPSPYGTATSAVFDASFANYYPTSTAYWFQNCSALTSISGVENLKTDNVTNMSEMFSDCSGLTALDVSGFKTDNVTDMGAMFSGCSSLTSLDVSNFNTANVTDMSWMFTGCSGLTSLNVSNFNTANVTDMSFMFSGCSGLTSLNVSNFNTANVTDMSVMFSGCSGLMSLEVSNFKTDNVTNMTFMFGNCSSLTSLDLSSFNTQNVTGMTSMFMACSSLTSLDVTHFNTQNVMLMVGMFAGCSSLTSLDLSSFNTQNVMSMVGMFSDCSSLTSLDLSSFNTANVTYMDNMFDDCTNLTTIYVGSEWSTAAVKDSSSVFNNCISLVGGQGTVYDANHVDASYAHIDGGTSNPGYLTLKLAKGDANGDGNINIADAVATVTNILGQPTEAAFYKYAADMNTDQVIDIFDVTLIVNAAFDAASPAPAMTRGSADNIMTENISMTADADYIYLGIDQPERFTATQFDVTLPEGMELVDARLASATTDHQLSFVKRGNNEYRVIGLSMSNTTFRSINGQLIKLEVSGSAVDSDVKMSNVLFVTPTATVMTSIDKCLNTAKMADDSLYDLKGQRLSKQQLGKGIYIMNHKKVIIK